MARRSALSAVHRGVIALAIGLFGCGGDKSWSCTWNCSSNMTSGSHTYPDGPDPTTQCTQDFGSTCASFSCSCSQG